MSKTRYVFVISLIVAPAAMAGIQPRWVLIRANAAQPYPAAVVNDAWGGSFFNSPDAQTWDLVVDLTNDRFNAAGLFVQGVNFFNSPVGNQQTPNPLIFPIAPALEYDTYVTAPLFDATTTIPNMFIGNSYVSVGPRPPQFTETELNVVWSAAPNAPAVNTTASFSIARLTFRDRPNPAQPYAVQGVVSAHSAGGTFFAVPPIPPVPEPALVPLFGVAAVLRQRRRRD